MTTLTLDFQRGDYVVLNQEGEEIYSDTNYSVAYRACKNMAQALGESFFVTDAARDEEMRSLQEQVGMA